MLDIQKTVAPLVHRNGNTEDSLVDSLAQACADIREALNSLDETAPNGRNFCVGCVKLDEAIRQHRMREQMLFMVIASLEAEIELIQAGKQRMEGQ